MRSIPAARELGRRYLAWWMYDLPPMHGLLRFVFYAGLLWLALDYPVSPLRAIARYESTSPELFRAYGLIDLLEIPHIAPEILRVVILATMGAWICAAIGLFSRASAVVTAAGAAFLHGMFLGSNALNHNWYLPTYALIALCFTARAPGTATRKQWMLTVVRPVLIEDFAAKPPGRIELDPERADFPAQRLLLDYLPVFRKHADPRLLQRYERLELTYPLDGGRVVIASVPLKS